MFGRTRSREAKPAIREYYRDIAECNSCGKHGNWWNIKGQVVCENCLGLTSQRQRAIVQKYGANELWRRLNERTKSIFNAGEKVLDKQIVAAVTAVTNEEANIETVSQELKARKGKLYLIENTYVNAARKTRKLMLETATAQSEQKSAKERFEAEKFAIDELEHKLIEFKITK